MFRIVIFERYFQIMGRFFILLLSVFIINSMNGQIHEFGAFVGGSNYIGDIGSTNYVAPNNLAYGILYKAKLISSKDLFLVDAFTLNKVLSEIEYFLSRTNCKNS